MKWDAPVTVDPAIREGLQRVDPTAELLYLAHGMWALVAKPEGVNPAGRRRIGRALLDRMRGRPDVDPVTERCAMLLAEGYGIVAMHRWPHAPTPDIVDWFKEADWRATNEFEQRYAALEAETDGTAHAARRQETLREYLDTEGRSIFRHAIKGRRHIS